MRAVILLLLLTLVISGCSATSSTSTSAPQESSRWFIAKKHPAKGVFLLVHGLNLRPSAMDPLATELTSIGYHVHRVTLHGHNGESSQIFDERVWLHEVAQSYEEIRSRFPEIPTYVMGYSLGGLALMTMLDTVSPSNYPRGMILLAPAISLRGPLDVLTALHLPPPLPLAVPNLAPKEYRRYDETPLFWYSNTLSLYRKSESLKHIRSLAAIPTLVVLNNSDEIVSPGGTARWIKDHNLEHSWRIEIVKPESSKFSFKEHLIIDEASLGSTEWSRLRTLLANFL